MVVEVGVLVKLELEEEEEVDAPRFPPESSLLEVGVICEVVAVEFLVAEESILVPLRFAFDLVAMQVESCCWWKFPESFLLEEAAEVLKVDRVPEEVGGGLGGCKGGIRFTA